MQIEGGGGLNLLLTKAEVYLAWRMTTLKNSKIERRY